MLLSDKLRTKFSLHLWLPDTHFVYNTYASLLNDCLTGPTCSTSKNNLIGPKSGDPEVNSFEVSTFDVTNPTPIKQHKDHVHINRILNLAGPDEIVLPAGWKPQNMTQIIMQHSELFRKFIKIWEFDRSFVSCVDPSVLYL